MLKTPVLFTRFVYSYWYYYHLQESLIVLPNNMTAQDKDTLKAPIIYSLLACKCK
jgi:hypothetical protein